jgi:hypothetical protein
MARSFGSKNKRALEREKKLAGVIAKLKATGVKMWEGGDPVDFLKLYMRNEDLYLKLRLEIARDIARYFRAAKTENVNVNNTRYVVALPDGEISMDEWQKRTKPTADDKKAVH